MSKEIIIAFNDRNHFMECLKENPGIILIKFGAKWCKPCQNITTFVYDQFQRCPNNIICCDLDIDINTDLYNFFKKNRQITGIPSIVVFYKNNLTAIPNLSISGTNINNITELFNKCLLYIKNMK